MKNSLYLKRNLGINGLSPREFMKHIGTISQQNQILHKKKIPEISFPLRASLLQNNPALFLKKNQPKTEEKPRNKQANLEFFQIKSNKRENFDQKFDDEIQKAIEESKRLYEAENQKEMQEIQKIYAEIQEFEKNREQTQERIGSESKNSKKRKDSYEETVVFNKSLKKIKVNESLEISSNSQMIPISDLELSNTYLDLEKNMKF